VPLRVTYQGQDTVVDDGSSAVIGSDAGSTVRIVRPGISRRHAVVSQTPSGWTIEDAGSRNGSYRFGERFESVAITSTETIYLGHPTDGEMLVLDPIETNGGSTASAAPQIETFVLPESGAAKTPEGSMSTVSKTETPSASDAILPPTPAVAPSASATRSRAQRTPREVDLAELTIALRDQINAVKGLTWSVWAMIAVTAALAVMTLFVGILGA
jgi:pSer/pThr/pTyr-binding forkhead associated (FHA) protein